MFPGIPRSAENDDTITRWPEPWARKIAAAASVWASAPMKLVSAVCLLASKRPVPSGWPLPRPALTTTRRPGWAVVISVASSARRSVRRAHRARSCPRAASWRAISAPSPLLAPVMRVVDMGVLAVGDQVGGEVLGRIEGDEGRAARAAHDRRGAGVDRHGVEPEPQVRAGTVGVGQQQGGGPGHGPAAGEHDGRA